MKEENGTKILIEASLSRIVDHFERGELVILTSYRNERTQEENEESFEKLKREIRGLGLGFVVVDGGGQEEDENDEKRVVYEKVLIIPNRSPKLAGSEPILKDFREKMIAISRKPEYEQFAIAYAYKGEAQIIYKNGTIEKHPSVRIGVDEYFTELSKERAFYFGPKNEYSRFGESRQVFYRRSPVSGLMESRYRRSEGEMLLLLGHQGY